VRLVARRAEDVCQPDAVEPVAQMQLGDLPVHRIHPGKRRAHQGASFRLLGDGIERPHVIHRLGRLIEPRRRDGRPLPRLALVAG